MLSPFVLIVCRERKKVSLCRKFFETINYILPSVPNAAIDSCRENSPICEYIMAFGIEGSIYYFIEKYAGHYGISIWYIYLV